MNNKDFKLLITKNKHKRIAKRVLSIIGISSVVLMGLIMLGFIIYGLFVGVYSVFAENIFNF
ncbi:hypothetical protein OF364_01355 [Mycoplasma enhydrae]|uniref:hypothetical protein n=1 Tax=Mycoplasma enhydrae TaxID=2499220 RepID=UPI00197C2460|nr:hypothetical protein [Mycoplasma enhydrae]MBN4089277.1 hypothetical protein [Mycoplasma enhydrae]MCV3733563.1 hypothetical protein [Mycoplasma enhydrae]MCV3753461.1 hypothetical protein [Mycoplasma enhydrae]